MLKRNAAVLLVATLVLGAAAYAWAQEAPQGPTVTEEDGQPAAPHGKGRGHRRGPGPMRFLHRAVHGDVIVPNQEGEGFRTVTFDRGTVTAVDDDSITVERADGQTVTKTVTDETKFGPDRTAADVETGRPAMVVSDGDTATAVFQPPARGNKRGAPGVSPSEAQVPAT